MKCNPAVATIAIDLAKTVFQVLAVDAHGNVLESHRLSRSAFIAFWHNRAPVRVVMEACGSAHHFGRWLSSLGHQVTLLPAQYVRPYVRRSKTDAADCLAMIEAARAIDLKPVPIKTELQQTIQLLHRARQQWQETRTARINLARGLLREFGIVVPEGAERGRQAMRAALGHEALDQRLRDLVAALLEEIRALEQRIADVDRSLASTAKDDPVIAQLESLPGIGWVTATEPLRLFRRLLHLRGWSHEEVTEVLPRGTGAGRSTGFGSSVRARFAVGSDRFDRCEDRLHGRDVTALGATGRA